MSKVVFVIAPKMFQDFELSEPKEVLESKGVECLVASKTKGACFGGLGSTVHAALSLDELSSTDSSFDGIVFVGGGGASIYFDDKKTLALVKNFFESGKVLAAICIAPSIFANAGVLSGKKATSFPSEQKNLSSKGAHFTGAGVEVDGKIITASGPSHAKRFGQEIAKALGK